MNTTIRLIRYSSERVRSKEHLTYKQSLDRKPWFFLCKRITDIVVSSLVILLVFPWLVPLVALAVRLDSSGPVFFKQKRIGKGGVVFYCFKFRTMIPNKEADSQQATLYDVRITRTGRWLRQMNIDELPQFINVWLGQMSMVGPRPHMQADCRHFTTFIRDYRQRHLLRPGITGLAQVKGFHGPAMEEAAILHRYQWDMYYIQHAGARMEMLILSQTLLQHLQLLFIC